MTDALSNDNYEVLLALRLLLEHSLGNSVDVVGNFLGDYIGSAAGDTCIYSDVTCTSAHDLNNGAAVMRLRSIAELVHEFHSSVHSSIEADSIVCASDIIVDSTGETDTKNALGREVCCASE